MLKVPFGLDPNGAEVRPTDDARVLTCVCPSCRQPLIYRHGPINQAHFAHIADSPRCEFWEETEDHWRAKHLVANMLNESQAITLRRRCGDCGGETEQPLPTIKARATVEHLLQSGLRADVALLEDGGQVRAIIEIFATHAVDQTKAEALAGLPWIELRAAEVLAAPHAWRPVQDHFRVVRCARCKYGATHPFSGQHRITVECPLPQAGAVPAATTCPPCPYFVGVRAEGIFCFGNDRAAR